MPYEEWLAQFTDWRPEFDYWNHFSFVDNQGPEQVKRLYDAFFEDSKQDYKKLTELVMTLNHKIWQKSQDPCDKSVCDMYSRLFVYATRYANKHLCGDELRYYLQITD